MNEIDKLAWLCIKNKQLLVVRSRGSDAFYIPGGKREQNESDQDALIREIKEELAVDLKPGTLRYVKTFKDQAHNKPHGILVKIDIYTADYTGEIRANSEIEEINWLNYKNQASCSLMLKRIMDWLKAENLIE